LPRQITSTSRGTRKYSVVCARAKELGGTMQIGPLRETKPASEKFFGSTTALSTLVKILNSSATRAS
jgi:hypothetical protein